MITSNDYLKFIQKMSEQEKTLYFNRVKKWTEEDYPRLCAVQEAWTENDFKSFDEGCILISALQAARAWLPSKIYQKDVDRRLTWVRDWLGEINKRYGNVDYSHVPAEQREELNQRAIYTGTPKTERPARLQEAAKRHVKAAEADGKMPPAEIARPKHLDAYIHLLSPEVQEAVASLNTLYLKRGEFHQMLHKLADDPRSNPADRERYAKAVAKASDTINAIYARVEAEWEALPESEKAKAGIAPAAPAEPSTAPASAAEPATAPASAAEEAAVPSGSAAGSEEAPATPAAEETPATPAAEEAPATPAAEETPSVPSGSAAGSEPASPTEPAKPATTKKTPSKKAKANKKPTKKTKE